MRPESRRAKRPTTGGATSRPPSDSPAAPTGDFARTRGAKYNAACPNAKTGTDHPGYNEYQDAEPTEGLHASEARDPAGLAGLGRRRRRREPGRRPELADPGGDHGGSVR